MGSDQHASDLARFMNRFQSTLPHGERRRSPLRVWCGSHFNPRSRMGSDPVVAAAGQFPVISIHAPAWGATNPAQPTPAMYQFQSTLPHGERRPAPLRLAVVLHFNPRSRMGSDVRWPPLSWNSWYFNPRSRMGSDQVIAQRLHGIILISIHAPAWGATCSCPARLAIPTFQSTLPHGERPSRMVSTAIGLPFQSTLPHGERRTSP